MPAALFFSFALSSSLSLMVLPALARACGQRGAFDLRYFCKPDNIAPPAHAHLSDIKKSAAASRCWRARGYAKNTFGWPMAQPRTKALSSRDDMGWMADAGPKWVSAAHAIVSALLTSGDRFTFVTLNTKHHQILTLLSSIFIYFWGSGFFFKFLLNFLFFKTNFKFQLRIMVYVFVHL